MTSHNYFVISDTHFGHENILKFDNPLGFTSIEERDEEIIKRWNGVVGRGDRVYHLGDIFVGSSSHGYKHSILTRLNGSKRLIVGNHDNIKYLAAGGWFSDIYMWRMKKELGMILTHVPLHPETLREDRWGPNGCINVHGHTHSRGSPEGPYRSVCVEMINYTPIAIEELKV
jgi:calcineurin-like phosphoesterase family protein